jgi:serine/threonine protein kinase
LGIMHRDIKLKNLLLDSDGTVKVADLGSIRETGRTQLKLTTAVVTLWYRPPELLLGAKDYTSAIDIWSVGCVFVELLALKPPFPGYSVPEMMSWVCASR